MTTLIAMSLCGCTSGQATGEIEGVWENIKIDSIPVLGPGVSMKRITIRKVGRRSPSYFVFFDKDAPLSMKRIGNNLVHYMRGDSISILIDPITGILKFDTRNILGLYDKPQFKLKKALPVLGEEQPKNHFFDLRSDLYPSGVPGNFVPGMAYLPFKINADLMRKRKITSLTILIYKAGNKLAYTTTFTFNLHGDPINVVEKGDRRERSWIFEYRKDEDRTLAKIVAQHSAGSAREYLFDADGWLVDQLNQKVIKSHLDWTYRNGLPVGLTASSQSMSDRLIYEYDKDDKLVQALDLSGDRVIDAWHYEYQDGLLSRVVID
ncbi:hypothetical protein [Pseudochryseolinea flava]|nr:hypothetical protein [Pseudochryseolinea flava]